MMGYGRGFWQCNLFSRNGYMGQPYGWMMMIAIVVIVVLILLFIRNNAKKSSKSKAIEALDLRHVKGEIDEETYLRIKQTLKEK